jgi:hypothetical protein
MPTKEEVMQQIFELVARGAGEEISSEVQASLRNRYFSWIDKKKEGVATAPIEIWDQEDGRKIQRQFERIGRSAVRIAKDKQKDKAAKDDYETAFAEVESTSPCPHCPEPSGP